MESKLNAVIESIKELETAWERCADAFQEFDKYEDINNIVSPAYPFERSFDEYLFDIINWRLSVESAKEAK